MISVEDKLLAIIMNSADDELLAMIMISVEDGALGHDDLSEICAIYNDLMFLEGELLILTEIYLWTP